MTTNIGRGRERDEETGGEPIYMRGGARERDVRDIMDKAVLYMEGLNVLGQSRSL